ncbi:MAG: cation diffusion facilitator family transporter [Nocardioidaceae bacterium]
MSAEESPKAVIAALAANLGIAATKVLAWVLTGSASMLAEAIHSFADSGNQGLLLLGRSRSRRAPTSEHPFGYARERYIYAFLVSIVLFSVGGLFALYEASHKYQEVHGGSPNELLESRWRWVPLVVLVAAICMESFSLRTAVSESNRTRGGATWVQFVRRAKSPELPVVLLEDVAALVGLVLALAGVGLTLLTRNGYWDVAGTTGIGLLLVTVAVVLGIETKSLLLGEAAALDDQDAIADAISGPGSLGLRIIHLRTLQLGPGSVLVACKIAVAPDDRAADLAAAIDAAEVRVRAAVPDATYVFIEPDVRRADA